MSNIDFLKFGSDVEYWMTRQAKSLPVEQQYRELFHNGIDAQASKIIVDYWESPADPETGEIHKYLRFTDNGDGMTNDELSVRLKTLLDGSKEVYGNHGIGARVTTLTRNPAGVIWASRALNSDTGELEEGQVTAVRDPDTGRYGLRMFKYDERYYTIEQVSEGVLKHLPEGKTGTAVILCGDGTGSTWTGSGATGTGETVLQYLRRKYWAFSPGFEAYISEPFSATAQGGKSGGRRWITGVSTGLLFAEAKGIVELSDLNIRVHWSLFPESASDSDRRRKFVPNFIGYRLGNEIFPQTDNMTAPGKFQQFGVIGTKAHRRVALVVEFVSSSDDPVNGVHPNELRTGLEHAGGREINARAIGLAFSAALPDEIDAAVTAAMSSSGATDVKSEVLRRLGSDFVKKLKDYSKSPSTASLKIVSSDAGKRESPEKDAGSKGGPPTPRQDRGGHGHEDKGGPSKSHSWHTPGSDEDKALNPRSLSSASNGRVSKPTKLLAEPNVPDVVPCDFSTAFVDIQTRLVNWAENANTVYLNETHPIILNQINAWEHAVKSSYIPKVKGEVLSAYSVEIAAKILHIWTLKGAEGWSPTEIETVLSPECLTVSLLGLVAVESMISDRLKFARKKSS